MAITLTADVEELITERIRSGGYESVDGVIREGLRLLEVREKGIAVLRREIMRGVEDIDEGRFTDYATDAEIEGLANDLTSEPSH